MIKQCEFNSKINNREATALIVLFIILPKSIGNLCFQHLLEEVKFPPERYRHLQWKTSGLEQATSSC